MGMTRLGPQVHGLYGAETLCMFKLRDTVIRLDSEHFRSAPRSTGGFCGRLVQQNRLHAGGRRHDLAAHGP
jgi:hypothetical protein